MAFLKRTWLARIGTGLNKFIIGNKDGEGKQTLTNAPDSVTQQGDVISADNLNDLEERIDEAIGSNETAIQANATAIAGLKLTKVWENPNPSSPYTATAPSDTIDIRNTKDFVVEYSGNNTVQVYKMVRIKATISPSSIYLSDLAIGGSAQYVNIYSRLVRITSEGISQYMVSFSDCNVWTASTNTVATDNSSLIPIAIYKVGDIYNS